MSGRRLLAPIAALVVLLLGAAAPALAADPTPTPSASASTTVVYTGSGKPTSDNATFNAQYAAPTFSVQVVYECATRPCTVHVTSTDLDDGQFYDITRGPQQAGLDGNYSSHDDTGDVCGPDDQLPSGNDVLTFSGASVSGVRSFDQSGTFDCDASTTAFIPVGYRLEFTALLASGTPCLVDGSCPTPTPVPSASATTAPVALASGSRPRGLGGPRFSDPGTLSTLPTAQQAASRPLNALWAVGAAVVLVILVAFPTTLLNSATEGWTERVGAWWRRRRPARTEAAADPTAPDPEAPAPRGRIAWRTWPAAAAGVLAAGVISAFVSPTFGFDGATLRTFLSILASFALDAVAGWFVLILLVRRTHPSATAAFRFAPATLLVVAVAVLFTRLTGFQPGIVFGLVAGVAFGAVVATADKARLALVGLGYSFGAGVIGWIGYSVIAATAPHPAAGLLFVQETLSSMAVGGFAALPIALVPLRGLTGATILAWNRWVWGGAYLVGLAMFLFVLMPLPTSWQTVPLSLGVWIAIFVAYAIAAVVLWLLATRPWRREEAAEGA